MPRFFRSRRRAYGALERFYSIPGPSKGTALEQAPLLAVDVETTGLDPRKHRMLSIGWVPINGRGIALQGAGYCLINTVGAESVGESATIHGLTDEALALGVSPVAAMEQLLEALEGRALVAHFSSIERDFVSALCREHFGSGLSVPVVDTFELERRHMERMGTFPRGEDLRLPRVRERYGLPRYSSHNALTDALACAELYLALAARSRATTLGGMLV
ncbi:3'-5' exonuclease [Corynebacterium sp. zg254]|uniref:3'-5' exonuclease n=1 Tax=Corynebacterium zhongnanshanii TaxID=2768834 RepID=A0ABQ6VJG0_9CORY|nr:MULTISPECIES: exonuclease domain-containing protein [Corynebacterium]KAB3523266.1 3'-5' exonuclease [Corynebacterium zhongnanshanii]MCR5913616.1 3'-5' exonuclease [Corynebacterium sp. zg254]